MAVVTVIYACVVVYATGNAYSGYHEGYRYVVYTADEYESDVPPAEWYMPEELGIFDINDFGVDNATWVYVAVDREKEPFPLQKERPIFIYKDKFYRIADVCAIVGSDESNNGQLIAGGIVVGLGWVFAGALFVKAGKARRER